jgi:hypothetical protein
MSLVPQKLWDTLDLFFLCYSRFPGMVGWAIQRMSYPGPGLATEQDNWQMWAFDRLERSFYNLQNEQSEEKQRAQDLATAHRQKQSAQKKRHG